MYIPPSVCSMDGAAFVPVHLRISTQADRFPHRPAVVCGGEKIHFQQMEQLAQSFAALLKSRGLGLNSRIALLCEPGIPLIVSLLAIHKIGAAFVPLSFTFPQQRMDAMLKSSSCMAIVGDRKSLDGVIDSDVEYIAFDREELGRMDIPCSIQLQNDPESTAYIHFTSGSTGTPKGVNILHRNLTYYVDWSARFFQETVKNRLPMTSAMHFAASISQIYSSLAAGETLHILPGYLPKPEKIFAWYADHPDFGFYCVPTVWKSALDWWRNSDLSCRGPVALFLSGEAVYESLLEETFSCFPDMEVWNLYGPTEAVANLSCKRLRAANDSTIGTPLPGTRLYVVKEDGTEAGAQEEGLLYAAGPGISAGYIANKQLTEKAFFPYQSPSDGSVRVYNTGDIVRLTDSLELQFIGRKDQQVKIHGQRIELGEIENRLLAHPQIRNAVVVFLAEEDPCLVAYLETTSDAALPVDMLRGFLARFVTEVMLPQRWIFLPHMPKLENGKIDRKSLPAPDNRRPILGTQFSEAEGAREEKIIGAFQKVLNIQAVGMDDSFFDLGGNSLKALALLIEIEERFSHRLSFQTLFANPDARSLLQNIPTDLSEKNRDIETICSNPHLSRESTRFVRTGKLINSDLLPLTAAQRGLLFFQETYPENGAYTIAYSISLEGTLDIKRLQDALEGLLKRHLPLHSRLSKGEKESVFVPEKIRSVSLVVELLSGVVATERERFVGESISRLAASPFRMDDGPLFRCKLYRLSGEKHVLAWVVNHLVFDGESMAVLLSELQQLYKGKVLAPLPVTFAAVVEKRAGYQHSEAFAKDHAFWQNYLQGAGGFHAFPKLYRRPEKISFQGQRVRGIIDKQLRGKLLLLCRAQGVSLYTVLLAAFAVTLHKFGQQKEYLIATPFANRLQKSESTLIGYFVNTLLYRIQCPAGCRFSDLLAKIATDTIQMLDHQQLPFGELVRILRKQGLQFPPSFFRTLFALHDITDWSKPDEELSIKAKELFNGFAKCDLHFECFDDQQTVTVECTYDQDIIDESAALQLQAVFIQVLQEVSEQCTAKVDGLAALTEEEKDEVLRCSVGDKKEYGAPLTLFGLFQKSCNVYRDLPALSFAGEELTYEELKVKVTRCAAFLASTDLQQKEPVGIYLDNTPELIIAILAAASLGHPYVPLDPGYPQERIRYISEHAGIRHVLTATELKDDPFFTVSSPIFVDAIVASDSSYDATFVNKNNPDDLLYIIYTSGSTGKPKGVMLPNRGVANYLLWMKDCFHTGVDTRILARTSISFDISVWELFLPLISGGTLYLERRADIESPEQTALVIEANGVNIFQFVPSALKLFADAGMFARTASLQKVFCGGEKMPLSLRDEVLSQFDGELYNLYGPTEASIFMSYYHCKVDSPLDKVSIGRPIPNSSLYVLDNNMRLLPRNVAGDLYIGGDILATGYLNDQEKTDKVFCKSPKQLPEKRVYATGDRGRLLSCGKFELLGRDDHQVKIRGYRVELQEIDRAMEHLAGVRQAVTYMQQNSEYDARLHVVVVPDRGAVLTEDNMRAELKSVLPAYMIPSSITLVQSIPLLPNGKINQGALGKQEMMGGASVREKPTESKNDTVEKRIFEIWAEVLGQENFTSKDNFFDVGGHSLLFIKIKELIRSRLDTNFSIVELYKYPNIASMVAQYRQKNGNVAQPAVVSAVRKRIARRIRKYNGKE